METAAVSRDSLVLGDELGKGGQGRVFAVIAPDFGRPVVYKEYKAGIRVDRPALTRMVDAVQGLSLPEQTEWLSRYAWPLTLVDDSSAASGFIMPRVPDRFHTEWERNGTRTRRIAEFQHLLNSPDFVAQRGIRLDRSKQYALLAALAESLERLHAIGISVGDLSPKNLLFDVTSPTAAVFILDCDAMAHTDDDRSQQVETPGWGVPTRTDDRERLATPASDAYKFGLLALRLLAGSQDATSIQSLPDDAGSVRPLLERSLDADPRHRPTPGSWIPTLRVAATRATQRTVQAPRSERVPPAVEESSQSRPVYPPETRNDPTPATAAPPARTPTPDVGPSRLLGRRRHVTELTVPPLPSELQSRLGSEKARAAHIGETERQWNSVERRSGIMNVIAGLLRFLVWPAAGLTILMAVNTGWAQFQKWNNPQHEYTGHTHAEIASWWLIVLAFAALACFLGYAAYRARRSYGVTAAKLAAARRGAIAVAAITGIDPIVDAQITIEPASEAFGPFEATAYLVTSSDDWSRSKYESQLRLLFETTDSLSVRDDAHPQMCAWKLHGLWKGEDELGIGPQNFADERIHLYSLNGAPIY